MHSHFLKEEDYALPPLGLLRALSEGRFESAMADVLSMTDKLKAELPTMLAEQLMFHAQTEEQVSYPAAILIGEFVKLRLSR